MKLTIGEFMRLIIYAAEQYPDADEYWEAYWIHRIAEYLEVIQAIQEGKQVTTHASE